MIELIIYIYLGMTFSIYLTNTDSRFSDNNLVESFIIALIFPIILSLVIAEQLLERFSNAKDRKREMP